MDNNMSQDSESPKKKSSSREDGTPALINSALERRRQLIKGGLSAPILMSIVSRQALGANFECRTASGFSSVSINHSPHGTPLLCSGRTPGYWKQKQWFGHWRTPYFPVATNIGSITYPATPFAGTTTGFKAGPFSGKTMLEVLGTRGGDTIALGRHITAALLNAAAGLTPVLTTSAVVGMWNEYVSKGYFEPTAGIHWDSATIIKYLLTTQPI
jgi:hypothetical protein